MSERRDVGSLPNSYEKAAGIAALLLAESTILALVRKGALTRQEARTAIGEAMKRADQEAEIFDDISTEDAEAIRDSRQFLEGLIGHDDLR